MSVLVPALPGSHGQRVVKRHRVCVCVVVRAAENGNIEALIKLGLAYLYNEGCKYSTVQYINDIIAFFPDNEILPAKWNLLIHICECYVQGVYNSCKYWKSPGILLMLLEKFITSSVIFCALRLQETVS